MNQKKYLKWYNKVGYGSGDLSANLINALVSSFAMIFLTDTVGLNSAVIGVLIMFSKVADGITDVFFGHLIDKTHTKMGKARPWMLWSQLGNVICLIATFAIPTNLGQTAQYAYFFIFYTLLNAIFFTANNISYSSLTSLITKNVNERVQMGTFRKMFALATNVIVASITMKLVDPLGGGATGWRNIAIIYGIIAIIVNTISVFSVKELPEEAPADDAMQNSSEVTTPQEKTSFIDTMRFLVKNKYFIMIAMMYIFIYIQSGVSGVGTYWCKYVYGNTSALGMFTAAQLLPIMVGLSIVPFLVKKFNGIYKVNLIGYSLAILFRLGFGVAGLMLNIPLMLIFSVLAGLCTSPISGDINALISETADYTYRTQGKHVDGAMFSCSSLGIKIGSGIGTALCGILLDAGGYINAATTQPASAISMLNFMYLFAPLIMTILQFIVMYFLKVEKANRSWDAAHNN